MNNIADLFSIKLLTVIVILAFSIFTAQLLAGNMRVEAQNAARQACLGAGGTPGANGACDRGGQDLVEGNNSIFNRVINILSFIVGAVSVIMLIVGGLRYVLSNGDPNSVTAAKNTILYAIVGLIVAFAAQAVVIFILNEL